MVAGTSPKKGTAAPTTPAKSSTKTSSATTPHPIKRSPSSTPSPSSSSPPPFPSPPLSSSAGPLTAADDLSPLRDLFAPHVSSFDAMLAPGGLLDLGVSTLPLVSIDANPSKRLPSLRVGIEAVSIGYPARTDDSVDTRIFPSECRELGTSYSAPLMVHFHRQIGDGPIEKTVKRMGLVPIMVRSARCHLQHASPDELVARHEEATEQGGFFIVNGIDRLIRLLIVPRRHYVTCVIRPSFTNRGADYTKFACQLRCVRPDQSSKTLTLHYLATGGAMLRFSLRKQEFFIPALLIMRALVPCTDREVYDALVQGRTDNAWLTDRVELMLRGGLQMRDRGEVLRYLGKNFRLMMRVEGSVSDEDVGRLLLSDVLFVHCQGGSEEGVNQQKFHVLCHMMHKLYELVQGHIKADNPDALHCQEIMLPGHLYAMLLRERLEDCLQSIKSQVLLDVRLHPSKVDFSTDRYFRQVLDVQKDIGKAMHYFLVTGNLISPSGLDLMQTSGFTIVAERLNYYRYISHYRSVHRGQFFTTMKTTDVRKLMPESFGFMCPAHTPDGAPCGLLNHFTSRTTVLTEASPVSQKSLMACMVSLGLQTTAEFPLLPYTYIPVILDGLVMGKVHPGQAAGFVQSLRLLKVQGHPAVYRYLEIYAILDSADSLYPAIQLYSTPARVMRPVRYLRESVEESPIEWIGSQEQITLEIAIVDGDYREGETTHQELSAASMLSVVASMTPFSDFNQSPRNMYQCQMAKQTMGTPFHAFLHRVDNKVFRIQNPQSPLVRNENYERYRVDDYPTGTNAVVAVLAYTGYDMEDACIINRSAYDRGFKHGSVYKYKQIDLTERRKRGEGVTQRFSNINPSPQLPTSLPGRPAREVVRGPGGVVLADPSLDVDGLPRVGAQLKRGDALYAVVDDTERRVRVTVHKEDEDCVVEDVRVLGDAGEETLQKVGIKLRFNRNPVIGDKFASRAGQKGVMSILYPAENMPFTESGMTPDIIINPHAFPSRMTIGMLIESMAGKSGALHGRRQDSTPFQFSEDHRAVDYFGDELVRAGYNYVGSEPMYSGVTGEECRADVFIGVVYYQRLRHMVSDKAQVRATGPVNRITRQPIKGRKVHGGIRFGEMERDSLLGHGTAFLLHDRLMNCSDYHTGSVCTLCGSLLSPTTFRTGGATSESSALGTGPLGGKTRLEVKCKTCGTGDGCTTIAIPYVFMYLANELAAMGVKLTLNVK